MFGLDPFEGVDNRLLAFASGQCFRIKLMLHDAITDIDEKTGNVANVPWASLPGASVHGQVQYGIATISGNRILPEIGGSRRFITCFEVATQLTPSVRMSRVFVRY